MPGKYKLRLNDDRTGMTVYAEFTIPIKSTTGEELTEGQAKAVKAYCEKFIPADLSYSNATDGITINACEIYRSARRDKYYYDADTGKLYSDRNIFDGQHEIRVSSSESQKNGENQAKAC